MIQVLPRQRIPFPPGLANALAAVPPWSWGPGGPCKEFVVAFQKAAARFLGRNHAVAFSSGRHAMAAMLRALAIPPGAGVGVPAFTFHAVPFAIREMGFRPVFLDVDPDTFNVGVAGLETALAESPDLRAVVVTHTFGVPAPIQDLARICLGQGIFLVEDAAHRFEPLKAAAPWSIGAFHSLETSKPLSAMGGGLAVTDDADLAASLAGAVQPCQSGLLGISRALVRQVAQAVVTSPVVFPTAVYPAGLVLSSVGLDLERRQVDVHARVLDGDPTALHPFKAAVAMEAMKSLDLENGRRRHLAGLLDRALDPGIPRQLAGDPVPPMLFFSLVAPHRDRLAARLLGKGIDTKRDFLVDCAFLANGPERPVARRLAAQVLHLPLYPSMSDGAVLRMAEAVNSAW